MLKIMKAVGTRVSGYMTKQLNAAFQGKVIDKHGTDCGTKRYVPVKITKWNQQGMLYSYIMEKGKPVLLTRDNIGKYIGKKVMMRNPMTCTSEKICNICAGERFYKQGITNIGLTTSRVSATLLNMNMKKRHDTTVKITKLDLNELFI